MLDITTIDIQSIAGVCKFCMWICGQVSSLMFFKQSLTRIQSLLVCNKNNKKCRGVDAGWERLYAAVSCLMFVNISCLACCNIAAVAIKSIYV